MKKRILSLLMVLSVMITLLPIGNVYAANILASGTCGGNDDGANLTWELSEDGSLSIAGTGLMKNYASASAAPWYKHRASITELALSEGITSIGDRAFSGCNGLTRVDLPNSVVEVGTRAFMDCASLTEVSLGTGVEQIGDRAFQTPVLEAFAVASGNLSYCDEAGILFDKNKTELLQFPANYPETSYVVPRGVTKIGKFAFYRCKALTTVELPKSLETIESAAFNSSALSQIILPDHVTSVGESAFAGCSQLSCAVLPSSLQTLEFGTFSFCTGLQYVVLSDQTKTIGDMVFDSGALEDIYFLGAESAWEEVSISNTFNDGLSGAAVHFVDVSYMDIGNQKHLVTLSCEECEETLPEYTKDCSDTDDDAACDLCGGRVGDAKVLASGYCGRYTETDMTWSLNTDGVLTFEGSGEMALYEKNTAPWFAYKDQIKTLNVKDGVGSIGRYAFYGYTALTGDVILPESLTKVGGFAFQNCTGLNGTLDLGSAATIGNYAFHSCSGLTGELVIPDSCTDLGTNAFVGCVGFESLVLGKNLPKVKANTFTGCSGMTKVELYDRVTSVADYAFHNTGVTEVLYHGSQTQWGEISVSDYNEPLLNATIYYITQYCGKDGGTNLTWALDANGVLTISGTGEMEDYAKNTAPWCAYKDRLTALVIEDGVTSIGKYAFYGCSGFTGDLILPVAMTTIGGFAFQNCSGFDGILDLGGTVTIGNYAFHSCSGFTGDLVIPDSCTSLGTYAFYGCKGFEGSLYLSRNLTKISMYAFNLCTGLTGELIIPESVRNIGAYAFYRCENMTGELVIPEQVTVIGNKAFDTCTGLTEVYFKGDAPTVTAADDTLRSFVPNSVLHYLPAKTGWTDSDAYDAAAGTWNGYALVTDETQCIDEDRDTYCDDCGKQIVFVNKVAVAGSNMNLGNELQVNFIVNNLPEDGEYVAYIHQATDEADGVTYEIPMSQWEAFGALRTKISVRVRAMEMTDTLTLTIKDADGYDRIDAYSTSVREYAGKALVAASSTELMKILVVDMVNYGAAAQTNFKYKTNDLANAQLTEEQAALASSDVACANNQIRGTNNIGSNLALDDCILLNVYFQGLKGKDMSTITAKVSFTNWKNEYIEGSIPGTEFELYGATGDRYKVVVDDIVLADAKCLVTVELYEDGTEAPIAYGSDSVESYANRGSSTAAAPLYKAIMKFAASAKAYLLSRNT